MYFGVVTIIYIPVLIFSVYLIRHCGGAPEQDRVLHLPGLDVQPNFNHYAGHLQATGTKKFFYW